MSSTAMANKLLLIETWRLQWVLLQLSVQLDQRWMPSLRSRSDDAVEELFCVVGRIGGLSSDCSSLGEMRTHLLEQILVTGTALSDSMNEFATFADRLNHRWQCAEDVLFIARTLERAVGMHSVELTVNAGAQRTLWVCISFTRDRSRMPQRGPDLMRQTCSHVLSRLDEFLEEERRQSQIPLTDRAQAMRSQSNYF